MAAVTGFGSNPPCLAAKSGLFAGEVRINLNYSFSILFKYFHCVWIFKDHESCSLEAAATVCCHFFSLFPSKEPLCCYGLTWNIDQRFVVFPFSRVDTQRDKRRRGGGEEVVGSCIQRRVIPPLTRHSYSLLPSFILFIILLFYYLFRLPFCVFIKDICLPACCSVTRFFFFFFCQFTMRKRITVI